MAKDNNMMGGAKDMMKEGVDIVKDTGDVIGDAMKNTVKSAGKGINNVSENVLDRD